MTSPFSPAVLDALLDDATAAAAAAARIVEAGPRVVEHKPDAPSLASAVVTDVDRAAESIITSALTPSRRRHGIGLLSEERTCDGSRFSAPAFWCVDPLDGTLPFVEGGDGFAVSIALVARDGTPLLGVVNAPRRGLVFRGRRDGPALLNGARVEVGSAPPSGPLTIAIDRSFDDDPRREVMESDLAAIAHAHGFGGVRWSRGAGGVLNGCAVIAAAPAGYVKPPRASPGGGSLWDFAASAAIVVAAGGVVTDAFGEPLALNRADSTFLGHRGVVFASSPDLGRALGDVAQRWATIGRAP